MNLKIITFNIRRNMDEGLQDFNLRKDLIKRMLRKENPDAVGFQEVMPEVFEWLRSEFTDYGFIGIGRSETFEDEATPIMYRKDLFELTDSDTFWLSETPRLPGSRYPGVFWPRICTRGTFIVKGLDKLLYWYNTHLDVEKEEARILGAELILADMEKTCPNEENIILTGDMNCEPGSLPVGMFETHENPELIDRSSGPQITSHGYGKIEQKIDFIFTSRKIESKDLSTIEIIENGTYISDHWPVKTTLIF